MKKNKITVIWGEAIIDAPGKITVKASPAEAPKGALGAGRLSGQAHHRRHRRAAARAAGPRARQEAGVDLFRGDGAREDAEVAAGRRLRRHRHRVRVVLPHHGRRGDRRRSAAADPAGRGRRDRGVRAQAVREAGHQDHDRRQGRPSSTRRADSVTATIEDGKGEHADARPSIASSPRSAWSAISKISGWRSSA